MHKILDSCAEIVDFGAKNAGSSSGWLLVMWFLEKVTCHSFEGTRKGYRVQVDMVLHASQHRYEGESFSCFGCRIR